MKSPFRIVLVVALALSSSHLSGCALAALGVATGYLGNQDKRDFQYMNLEREKAGLRPLSREEWKHQLNPGEVRRTEGDFAGVHKGGDVQQGQKRPAYSPSPKQQ